MEIKVNDKTYVVKKPEVKELNAAKKFSSMKFAEYINSGLMLRNELDEVLYKRGYWTEEKKNELDLISKKIQENVSKLDGKLAKEKKKELAIETKYLRVALNLLRNQQTDVYKHTVESRVDDDYFDFLVSESVFDENGNRVYSGFEDYQERSNEELAIKAATKLAEIVYGLSENWEKDLPENKILSEMGVLDESLQLKKND